LALKCEERYPCHEHNGTPGNYRRSPTPRARGFDIHIHARKRSKHLCDVLGLRICVSKSHLLPKRTGWVAQMLGRRARMHPTMSSRGELPQTWTGGSNTNEMILHL
jgi:hypothetical protein